MSYPRVRNSCLFILILILNLTVFPKYLIADDEPVFSIRTARLDGTDLKIIYTDAYRQATHIRISPDGSWIMFSRYNDKDPDDGLAKENWGGENHYGNTELVLMKADGSQLRSIIKPRKDIMAVNSNWTDDGQGFVYVSNDNTKKLPEIRRAWLNSEMEIIRTEVIALPEYLVPVDPHLYKSKLVFPAVDLRNNKRSLWLSKPDGSDLKQLTFPEGTHPESGDNDPRISPDSGEVAFMRIEEGKFLWNIHVVNIQSGEDRNVSAAYISAEKDMDAVPEWSGDGKKLIFWTVNLKDITFNIVTANPDGSERSLILKTDRLFHQSPAFFPQTGSGPDARIAFSTQFVSGWKLWLARLF